MKILSPRGAYTQNAIAVMNEFMWLDSALKVIHVVADPKNKRHLMDHDEHEKISQLLSIYSAGIHYDGAIYMAMRGAANRSVDEMLKDLNHARSDDYVPVNTIAELADLSNKWFKDGDLQPEHIVFYIACFLHMRTYGVEFPIPDWEDTDQPFRDEVEAIMADKYTEDEAQYLVDRLTSIAVLNANTRNVKMHREYED